MQHTYLDYTATTPMDPEVADAMHPFLSGTFGNASSSHWFGREAKAALEKARGVIALALGAEPGEVFFMSGGTESDNLAIQGVLGASRKDARRRILISAAEHHAVLDAAHAMREEGCDVDTIPVDGSGMVDPHRVASMLNEPANLISVMHANNEVGTINPIAEIAAIAHDHHCLIHTDAVQSFGKIPLSVGALQVDLATITAHKLYGPKGIGALFVKRGTDVAPLFHGGGQERGKRPGTENVALAVGFARAVELAQQRLGEDAARLGTLRDTLQRKIQELPFAHVNANRKERLPNILSVSFDLPDPAAGEMLVPSMDLEGVAVSSGSACTSGSIQPSHVLLAMGCSPDLARATIRFSFGRHNTPGDVDIAFQALSNVLHRTGVM